jgi:hypothetical protein
MKIKFVIAAIVASCLATSPAVAQTPSETLQRAIFAQDAQGNLDGAIQGYREVANSTFAPRDVAVHAQYRLSQALLLKGDLPAATRELERLEEGFPEYRSLIANQTAALKTAATKAGRTPDLFRFAALSALVAEVVDINSDVGPSVTLRGTVHSYFLGDEVFAVVEAEGRRHAVVLGTPWVETSTGEISKVRFKVGETVTVDARHPFSQPLYADSTVILRAQTITRADGTIAFKTDGTIAFKR